MAVTKPTHAPTSCRALPPNPIRAAPAPAWSVKRVLTLNNVLALDTGYKCTVHSQCLCPPSAYKLLGCFLGLVSLMFSLLFHLKLQLSWKLFHSGMVLPILLINTVIYRTDPCVLLLGAFTIWKLFFNDWVKPTPLSPFNSKTVL